ncbi:hypothetical protein THAOC_20627 [Thalassiosira oceanica]|uniref:Uncharacterized protein n=1 Tax=Thalassiosira oceanica TaxID=159749 RepID=K0RZJ1_THAOC|nr:hypothetical protein THAOC_20627 [Thalassiosira oceanica]|eukprot:EJK59183.1 hypothetical protein THAOC_20627 [Thalassiosira oceanica]
MQQVMKSSLAQLVERETVNLEAVSSILTGRASQFKLYFMDRAIFRRLSWIGDPFWTGTVKHGSKFSHGATLTSDVGALTDGLMGRTPDEGWPPGRTLEINFWTPLKLLKKAYDLREGEKAGETRRALNNQPTETSGDAPPKLNTGSRLS